MIWNWGYFRGGHPDGGDYTPPFFTFAGKYKSELKRELLEKHMKTKKMLYLLAKTAMFDFGAFWGFPKTTKNYIF